MYQNPPNNASNEPPPIPCTNGLSNRPRMPPSDSDGVVSATGGVSSTGGSTSAVCSIGGAERIISPGFWSLIAACIPAPSVAPPMSSIGS